VKKLPSYLKGLVERRARSAGDIERLEQLRVLLDEEIANARKLLDSADTLIRDFSPLLDPSQIQPVKPRKGRHGKLKPALLATLREVSPGTLPTNEIAFLVAEKLQIQFHSTADFRSWARRAVHRELSRYWEAGVVERIPVPGEQTRWRTAAAEGQTATLSDLRAFS
jgi:hypothetical protein